jgi:O-antigen ligase
MIQRKLTFYGFIGLLVSSLLFKKLLPFFIILLVLIWFIERDYQQKWNYLKRNPVFLLLPAYYLLMLVGFIHTENMDYGLQKMETRLPLFVLPLVLPTLKSLNFTYHKRTFTRVLVFSIFAVAVVCFSRAIYLYVTENNAINNGEQWVYFYRTRYFYGSLLSDFIMHPGYLAMYANVGIIVLLNDFKKGHTRRIVIIKTITILFLVVFVIFLYSKTAIALLLFILFAYGFRYAYKEKKIKSAFTALGLLLIFSALLYLVVPSAQTRFKSLSNTVLVENPNPASTEYNQLIAHAWKASRSTIQESPFFGHGTGDVWDVLHAKYLETEYTGAISKEVNAHNEYYQTGLALGLTGIVFLVFILLFWFYSALKKRHFPLLIWTLITAFALFFESYFSTQAGVVYVSLFLFFVFSLNNKSEE